MNAVVERLGINLGPQLLALGGLFRRPQELPSGEVLAPDDDLFMKIGPLLPALCMCVCVCVCGAGGGESGFLSQGKHLPSSLPV